MSFVQARKLLSVIVLGALVACGPNANEQADEPVRVSIPQSEIEESATETIEPAGDFDAVFDFDYQTAWAMVEEREQLTGHPHTLIETAQGPKIVPYVEAEGMAVVGGDVVLGSVADVQAWRTSGPVRGVAFNNVWFSDGNINWFTEPPSKNGLGAPGRAAVAEAESFLNTRTPVNFHRVTNKADSNLELKLKGLINVPGGTTWMYWISWTNPLISFADDPSSGTVLHEMGHALGFAHEFQRSDRDDFADMSECATADQFNFGRVTAAWKGTNTADNMSPFDNHSIMNSGYGCVEFTTTPAVNARVYRGHTNPESIHDINSLYRMYGNALSTSMVAQRMGHATASGDFDDDGYPDFVVASSMAASNNTRTMVLNFYRGVEIDPNEDAMQFRWMPWFAHVLGSAPADAQQVNLVAGDFNGDGIDDLATGLPWANNDLGEVRLLFVNLLPVDGADDETEFAPWGRQGVRTTVTLNASSFGLSPNVGLRLGAALASGKLSRGADERGEGNYDDLLIGAPGYSVNMGPRIQQYSGAVVHLRGTTDETPAAGNFSTYQLIRHPGWDIGFGKSIATIANFCEQTSSPDKDGIVIGAPQGNAAFVYGCASTSNHALQMPTRVASLAGAVGSQFGFSVEGTSLRRSVNGAFTSKYYVAVGSPKFEASGTRTGRVSLYDISDVGAVLSARHFAPSTDDGAEFGYAVKARQRSDASTMDPINDLMLAISAPNANIGSTEAGKVFLWQPFNADGSNQSTALVREPSSPDADQRYGESLTAIGHRRNFEHAGFVVGSPYSREQFATFTHASGSVDLLLDANTSSHAWDTRRIHINPNTSGDRAPN